MPLHRFSPITHFRILGFLSLIVIAGTARADTFSFSYTAGTINAAGTFTATEEGDQIFQLTGISGQRSGIPIVALSDYEGASNRLNLAAPTPIDYDGLSFVTAAGQSINLFASQDYPGLERELTSSGNNPSNGGFVLHISAVPTGITPEPSSLALLATGLLGTAGILRRRI